MFRSKPLLKGLYGRDWRNPPNANDLTEEQFSEFIQHFSYDANVRELRHYVQFCGRMFLTKELDKIFPALGFMDACDERGVFNWENSEGCKLSYRLFVRHIHQAGYLAVKRRLTTHYSNSPGWNDFYMVRWFVNRKPEDAIAIYWRAHTENRDAYHRLDSIDRADHQVVQRFEGEDGVVVDDPDLVKTSASWMVRSVRAENAEFEAIIADCERKHGALKRILPSASA